MGCYRATTVASEAAEYTVGCIAIETEAYDDTK